MTDMADSPAWFLAQIKPNSHQIALRNLERQGFETFLPLCEETRRMGSRFVTRARPLFPGYLFVALDMGQGHWRAINSTSGLTGLVCFGGGPCPVPRDLVHQLRARCDRAGQVQPAAQFVPGDRVAVTTGPFADFVARVEDLAPEQRVWVLMDLMGSQTRVAMTPAQLRAV